jgi:hypothetical protein
MTAFTARNYRCFEDREPARIELDKGFTAIVGPNWRDETTSGKAARGRGNRSAAAERLPCMLGTRLISRAYSTMKLTPPPLLAAAAGAACLCAVALAYARGASTPVDPGPATSAAATATASPSAATAAPPPAVAPPSPAPAETCIEVDAVAGGKPVTLEGRIVVDDTFQHPSRGPTRPFILRLEASRCAIGIDAPRVAEIHLAPTEAVALKPLVGQRVRVAGDPFQAHTAWHARDIVLMTTSAAPLR